MKKILLLLLILSGTNLFSAWEKTGNSSRIFADSLLITDFVVSSDGKYLFTYGSDSLFIKWNAQTGEWIKSKKISSKLIKDFYSFRFSLSSDGKTYIQTYRNFYDNLMYAKYFIYDTENEELLDSITDQINFTKIYGDYEEVIADYISTNQTLYYGFNYHGTFVNPNTNIHSGILGFIYKSDTGLVDVIINQGTIGHLTSSNHQDLLFYSQITDNYRNEHLPGRYSESINKTSGIFRLFQKNNIKIQDYTDIKIVDPYGLSTESEFGTDYRFGQPVFLKNGKLLLPARKVLYPFDLNSNTFDEKITKGILPDDSATYYYSSPDSNYYFSTIRNELRIFSADNYAYCNTFFVDSINRIIKLVNARTNDYVLISDDKGYIYKIAVSDIIRLKANFYIPDSTYLSGDSVKFYNCTTGYPDSWLWDFGDRSQSSEKNPLHVYSDTGVYTVKLIIRKGAVCDTVIKHNIIRIMPVIKPEFSYSVSGNFPVILNLKNDSKGIIDSVLWRFNFIEDSKTDNPVITLKADCDLSATLIVYSARFSDSTSKLIKINVSVPEHASSKILEEIPTDSLIEGAAIKGYQEGDGRIMYHLLKDSTYYKGSLTYTGQNLWSDKAGNLEESLTKTENGTYIFSGKNFVAEIDTNGIIGKRKTISFSSITPLSALNENVAWGNASPNSSCHYCNVRFFWMNNNLDSEKLVISNYLDIFSLVDPYIVISYNLFCYKALVDNNRWDYIMNYHLFRKNSQKYDTTNILVVNDRTLPFIEVNDFVRLNNDLLIISAGNTLIYFKNKGLRNLDTTFKNDNSFSLINYKFSDCSFRNLLKLNDSAFAAVGTKNESPVLFVLDTKGLLIDSIFLSSRYGGFEHVSVTPDKNLLLSGYRYNKMNVKHPYFAITKDIRISELINKPFIPVPHKSDSVVTPSDEIFISPNPSTNDITFSFYLDRNSIVGLEIYDYYGNLVTTIPGQTFPEGISKINYNMVLYSEGIYNAVLIINGKEHRYNKFILIR